MAIWRAGVNDAGFAGEGFYAAGSCARLAPDRGEPTWI